MVNQSLTFITLIEFMIMQQLRGLAIFQRDYSTLIKKNEGNKNLNSHNEGYRSCENIYYK